MACIKKRYLLLIGVSALIFNGCSIQKLAVNSLADMLAGSGGTVFTGDEDPELIGEALPFALKLYESLLSSSPDNDALLLTTGTGFISYSNIYVHTPSDMLPQESFLEQKEMRQRAKQLYLRGRDYVLQGIEVRHPGFLQALKARDYETAFVGFEVDDVPYLYWAAAGWFSAIGFDVLDTDLMITVPDAFALAAKALQLDETWGQGSIHELFISLYGSVQEFLLFRPVIPESGDSVKDYLLVYYNDPEKGPLTSLQEKGRFHYERALELSGGLKTAPYLSYALAFARKEEDPQNFIDLMESALEIDPKASPENTLANIVNQRKARWLLDNLDKYFILETDDEW